jgi:hypothetical protein
MTRFKTLIVSAALAGLAVSIGACGQSEELAPPQSIEISDPEGGARSITIGDEQRGATESYVEVEINGRDFAVAQWIDASSGDRHSVVSSTEGAIRYEHIAGAVTDEVVLTDAAGTRTVYDGDALGEVDEDAATLLMNLRPVNGLAGDTAYEYETWCVYYNTSDPDDWHLELARCTCAHWYSVFCPRTV